MIHWGFLILAFIAGAAACYGILCQLAKAASQVSTAVEEGSKVARFE